MVTGLTKLVDLTGCDIGKLGGSILLGGCRNPHIGGIGCPIGPVSDSVVATAWPACGVGEVADDIADDDVDVLPEHGPYVQKKRQESSMIHSASPQFRPTVILA